MAAPTGEAVPGVGPPISRRGDLPPLGPIRRGVRELGLALIVAGVIVLLFVVYQLWGTGIAEAHSQATLKRSFNAEVAAATGHHPVDAPTVASPTLTSPTVNRAGAAGASGPPASGAVDHLVIPKIHVDVFVVQGVSDDDLRLGPGHYPGTVLPGQDGNAAIAGHRTTYGAPFFSLNQLGVGDHMEVTDTSGRSFTYAVSGPPRAVSPDDVAILDPTPFAELTLTTCNPRYSDTSRLIVVARLVGRPPLPAPAAPAASAASAAPAAPAAPAAENLGRGDQGAWRPALLFGAAVVALWIVTRVLINRTRRWRRAGVFVLGIAVCLVPLWFMFENVVRLLPPNI
jgi:sortase A